MNAFLAYAIVASAIYLLVRLGLRFWSGNLKRGKADLRPVGQPALIGLIIGSISILGFVFKWAREDWMTYQWEREVSRFSGLGDVTDVVTSWLVEYFIYYPSDIFYHVVLNYLPLSSSLWDLAPFVAAALLAIPVVSLIARRRRGQDPLGPIQDFYIGFFAPLGIAPILGLAYGAVMAIVGLVGLLVVLIMFAIVLPGARRY